LNFSTEVTPDTLFIGHLEAYMRGILHRDTSDGNVWMWIPSVREKYAVPSWQIVDGKPHFEGLPVDSEWFPKRPGIAGDFGLALDVLKDDSATNAVITTVCISFAILLRVLTNQFQH